MGLYVSPSKVGRRVGDVVGSENDGFSEGFEKEGLNDGFVVGSEFVGGYVYPFGVGARDGSNDGNNEGVTVGVPEGTRDGELDGTL